MTGADRFNSRSLVKALDHPEPFEDWLQGTRYMQKYLLSLKFQTCRAPYVPTRQEHSKASYLTMSKRKCVDGSQRSRKADELTTETTGAAVGVATPLQHAASAGGDSQGSVRKHSAPQRKGRKSSDNCADTAAVDGVASCDRDLRGSLLRSYNRIKGTYTSSFPAMLTPYRRSYWTYKQREMTKDSYSGGSGGPAVTGECVSGGSDPQQKSKRCPAGARSDGLPSTTERTFLTGPPRFSPTPLPVTLRRKR
ncbi:uncharacterized protein TEOVI_000426800 [Trypanosoma equiperdum]|uniref:Uncharacterized protein n=4 Tax=Trypanozoon TaxID=39700 RepID=Q584U4_TRYB2|nr:hypothetical protein, conserved [Trypanosoma brucei gambiense DAL972]XP_845333.1 hypothetical protein, conserved [Trypanosoma brucei brucei TREU927]AAX80845.1 hypothetical protein, conserved [Trypanosoma brucei]RHW72020.1 hypothetical protein DPX39_060024300 [Trypanosoma brucei equiperdum]SCU72690.1 hypothetical protein, conserved [Trypanosoma equiperdum]AAZ11774.1 hypothetical protein, conserved [Trypanosoma brucei brucei TREU927]CBH11708.1 hypothetical protein, conserved [Trypanosoma bru|eukprot:XP_011773993.1 hypothetical protein, conserved [Trypanosoma brucei gambiense DAL972]